MKYTGILTQTAFVLLFAFAFSCNGVVQSKKAVERTLERKHYKMQYDTRMVVDSSDADFDFDSYFTFNTASDNGFISFFIYNTVIDEQEGLNGQVKALSEKLMKNPAVTSFDTWGNYKGHGAALKGKLMGLMKGELKIFVHSGESASFMVVYQVFESDKEKDLPGLDLMEKTFTLK